MTFTIRALMGLLLFGGGAASGQPSDASYEVARAPALAAASLLALDEHWNLAQRIAWGPPAYETTFRALWNEEGLLVRFDAADPDPWHTLRQRDDRLWEEEVVELFIDSEGEGVRYAEIQISPANVVCDLKVDLAQRSFDLAWNLSALESRVYALRDDAGRTRGWIASAFLPWSGFRTPSSGTDRVDAPHPGDRWRFNVFRIERPGGRIHPEQDAQYLAWSPTGQRSFHVGEALRDLTFR